MSDARESSIDETELDKGDLAGEDMDGETSEPEPCCHSCHQPLEDEYYESGGLWLCPSCRDEIERGLRSGSKVARFLRANLFGLGAAVVGFAIYFGLLKITGYEIGLVSILVGLMVGGAVKLGSRRRGGWVYQLVAMFWVYTAIGFSYGSLLIPDLIAEAAQAEAEKPKEDAAAAQPPVQAGEAPAAPVAVAAARPDPVPSLGEIARALVGLVILLLLLIYALPIVAGFHAPMGLVLIAIALWEAWKINAKVPIVINGPFAVEQA